MLVRENFVAREFKQKKKNTGSATTMRQTKLCVAIDEAHCTCVLQWLVQLLIVLCTFTRDTKIRLPTLG